MLLMKKQGKCYLMSNFEDKMLTCLEEGFPFFKIKTQYYINVDGNKYFFDFFIKELNVLIETHGDQHLKFTKHYHGTVVGFNRQKIRDKAKEIYAKENNFTLVIFYYKNFNKLTAEYVKEKIYEVI